MDSDELYTELILDLNRNPQNHGEIDCPHLRLSGGNPTCGDEVKFDLILKDGTIDEIKFSGHGCSISRAAESILTTMVKGKSVEEAIALTSGDLLTELGNIVQLRMKCALLGLHVLNTGLKKFKASGEELTEIRGIKI